MEGDLLRALAHGMEDEVRAMQDKIRWGVALYTRAEAPGASGARVGLTPPVRNRPARRAGRGSTG